MLPLIYVSRTLLLLNQYSLRFVQVIFCITNHRRRPYVNYNATSAEYLDDLLYPIFERFSRDKHVDKRRQNPSIWYQKSQGKHVHTRAKDKDRDFDLKNIDRHLADMTYRWVGWIWRQLQTYRRDSNFDNHNHIVSLILRHQETLFND